jgi:transposase
VAAATHLNKNCGMSWRRISRFFCDLFGLTVSAAGLCRAFQRVANRGQPLYDDLRAQMHAEPVVSPDETSWRVSGEGAWLHTAAAPGMTLYSIARGRGFEEAAFLIGEDYGGILAVDGWAPYRRFPATIQTCLAHLLRRSHELQKTPRPETSRLWLEAVSTLLKRALALRDRRMELSEHGFASVRGRIEAELDRLLDDPPLEDDTLTFAAHLVRERHELFVFLDNVDVPATNHRAEQAIRPAVVNRKMNGGNRTWRGAYDQAVVNSLLRTWAQRGQNAIDQCVALLTSRSLQAALALVR